MESLLYLGKVNLYWILFFGCYWFLLRNHTFFKWNRAYLLGSLALAFIVPLIEFPNHAAVTSSAIYAVSVIPVYVTTPESESYFSHWIQFVWAVQLIGACIMFSKIFESVKDLIKLIKQGESIEFEDYKLVLLPHNEIGSFSFFKYLVISQTDYEQYLDPILRHESVHIRQYHSLDILFIELLKAVFWFNPVLWFYKRSIQEVHEFLADKDAPNRDHYARFLVSYTLAAPIVSLTNHFFNSSLLKSRIKMIYKNRNSQWALGKYLTIVPIIGVTLMLTAARERLLDAIDKENYKVTAPQNMTIEGIVRDEDGNLIKAANVVVKEIAKGTATDDNGKFKLDGVAIGNTLVISHKNYETLAIEITGAAKLDFITLRKKDNNLNKVLVEPKTEIKQTEPDTDQKLTITKIKPSAYPEIENKPDLSNGRDIAAGAGIENWNVRRTISVPASTDQNSKVSIRGRGIMDMDSLIKPLIILDGVESDIDVKIMDPKNIESIEVLKGQSAMSTFGFKGRNGVINITTKKR